MPLVLSREAGVRDHVATSKAKGLPSPVREGIPGPFGIDGLTRGDLSFR